MNTKLLFLFIVSTISSLFAQKADTLIFIPLGDTKFEAMSYENIPFQNVSCGFGHANLHLSNGKVFSLPSNQNLGFSLPSISDPVKDIQTGAIHSLLLFEDSTISQFLTTTDINMFFPWKLKKIREIRCGVNMSLAIKKNNIMYTWGSQGLVSQLGIPPKTYGVRTSSLGKNHVAFINIKDKVFVWGDNSFGQDHIPTFRTTPHQIVSGDDHVLAVDIKGNLYSWGKLNTSHLPEDSKDLKVSFIDAKGNNNLIGSRDNQVLIWNQQSHIKLDFKSIGEVQFASLGQDYAVIGLKKHQESPTTISDVLAEIPKNSWINQDSLTKDSTGTTVSMENILNKYFTAEMEDTNRLFFKSLNSKYNLNNSNTSYEFDGKGNKVTIINENMIFNHNNSYQRVIFKGSGKNYVIRQNNSTSNIKGSNTTIVIDLDELGVKESYSEIYNEVEGSGNEEINYDEIFLEIDPENFEVSTLSYFPVYNNFYIMEDAGFLDADDYPTINEYAEYLADGIDKAQAYFYTNDNQKAFETLNLCMEEGFDSDCPLALFEVYYYGLFNEAIDMKKAKYYLAKHDQIIKSYENSSEETEDDESLYLKEKPGWD